MILVGALRRVAGRLLDVEKKTSGFYQEDAQRLAADAARRRSAPRVVPRIRLPDGPILFSARERPLLKPDAASNQNSPSVARTRPPKSVLRRLAQLLLLPWALVVLAGSVTLIGLVLRLGLHF